MIAESKVRIIRFSDNGLQGCYCTYGDAVLLGRKLADRKGLGSWWFEEILLVKEEENKQ